MQSSTGPGMGYDKGVVYGDSEGDEISDLHARIPAKESSILRSGRARK